ncbi:MAG: restriction endonuclease [Arcicella sp.]|nr:restriction endonuclease [Arcicella sp.]
MGRLIQVFEHDKLTSKSLCIKGEVLGDKIIDRLWQYNDSNKNIYFEAIRHGIKFKNYVGVIQIGGTTIEILPKADKLNTQSLTEKENWHRVLLKMLAHCKKIKVNAVSEASLKKKYQSLLDLYFELFLSEVNQLLQQGLIKRYNQNNGNVLALKGRLHFAKNIQQNVIRQERFYTTHQVYDYNHLVNQILYKALKVLKIISNNTYLIDGVNRLLSNFPEIKEVEINKSHFDKLTSNRKTAPYNEAIKIAKMILLNYSPDIKGGDENMLALLFDMNKLWEEYIYRMLLKVDDSSIKVSFQNRDKFWENKIIKPDIVITKTKWIEDEKIETHYIIDTKWKVKEYAEPDDDDLKQMYVYNMYWESEKSMLLYPTTKELITDFGKFHKGKEGDNFCKLGFVKVMNKRELNMTIGGDIIALLRI